jgi:hypothetical protein
VLAARDGGEGDGPPAPAPVAKPAPPAAPERKPELPANERKELEAVIKVLEREVDTLRGLLSEQERLLAESTPRGTEKDKLAKNRNRYEETEEEYRRVNREAMKLAVEAQVLKQTIDHKEEVEPPASLIEAEFARDARLVPLREVLRTARNSYAFVVNMAPGGPQVDEAKKELAKAEDALKRREGELRKEVTARVREQLTAKHRERLAEVNIELKVKTEYAKRLKNEADALREVVAGLERALDNNSDLLQSRIEQLRAHLARVETELFAVRLTARGVPMQPVAAPAASDDKLDRILRELAALRKDVQELKAQRK